MNNIFELICTCLRIGKCKFSNWKIIKFFFKIFKVKNNLANKSLIKCSPVSLQLSIFVENIQNPWKLMPMNILETTVYQWSLVVLPFHWVWRRRGGTSHPPHRPPPSAPDPHSATPRPEWPWPPLPQSACPLPGRGGHLEVRGPSRCPPKYVTVRNVNEWLKVKNQNMYSCMYFICI